MGRKGGAAVLLLAQLCWAGGNAWPADAATAAQVESISDAEYRQIRDISLQLPGKHTASDVLILGPGRSPYAFTQFWQLYLPGTALGFPLTGFRNQVTRLPPWGEALSHFQPTPSDAAAREHYPLPPAEQERLFTLFDSVLEGVGRSPEKAIVVVDYGRGGTSLLAVTGYLRKYLEAHGLKNPVEPVLVTLDENLLRVRYYIDSTGESLRLIVLDNDSPLGLRLKNQSNDSVSPYGKYSLSRNEYTPPGQENRNQGYQAALRSHVESDPVLAEPAERAKLQAPAALPATSIARMEMAVPTHDSPNPNVGKDFWKGKNHALVKLGAVPEAVLSCVRRQLEQ